MSRTNGDRSGGCPYRHGERQSRRMRVVYFCHFIISVPSSLSASEGVRHILQPIQYTKKAPIRGALFCGAGDGSLDVIHFKLGN
jgi:hypothetical protein